MSYSEARRINHRSLIQKGLVTLSLVYDPDKIEKMCEECRVLFFACRMIDYTRLLAEKLLICFELLR